MAGKVTGRVTRERWKGPGRQVRSRGGGEVHLGQRVEDVEDGGLGDEVGVRAGRAAVRAGAPREMGAVPSGARPTEVRVVVCRRRN
ncbi:hypothetical protein GCM10023238_26780 [Streptomyces heliomycini]